MPTYEFACPNGHEFEKFYRKISDAVAEVACPTCGAIAARQLSGGAGLLFKGSGFYLTDYGKNAHRSGGEAKKGEGAGGEAKGGEAKGGEGGPAKESAPKADAGASKAGDAPKPAESKPAAPKKSE